MGDTQSDWARLDAIRVQRAYLIEQIRLSKRTIERSRELLRQLDQVLAKDGLKP
jgi:hypothetical protein